jgi:hypothetical protein
MQLSALFNYPNLIRGYTSLQTIVIKYILPTLTTDFFLMSQNSLEIDSFSSFHLLGIYPIAVTSVYLSTDILQ